MKSAVITPQSGQSPRKEQTEALGGVTSAKGFQAVGAHVGIKREKKDLALLWSDVPAHVAAVFTTNVVKAAPILWTEKVVANSALVRGIVINSGNANACTGQDGLINSERMAVAYAAAMGVSPPEILVSSTGVIGVQLPITVIENGIKKTATALNNTIASGQLAAEAIMTTDTYAKQAVVEFYIDDKKITIGGMAKGSGMIHPNMATMLAFLTTDLNITSELLSKALKDSNAETYNMISVDGDTSTNDMVTILANGAAGNEPITKEDEHYISFCQALKEINTKLATSIVQDGEGATKFLECIVEQAGSLADARKLARSVVSSSLTKAAFFGEDANWGRIICALGYSGVKFDPSLVSIAIETSTGKLQLMKSGEPVVFDEAVAKTVLAAKKIVIRVQMQQGTSQATAWGCDLSYDYVRINGAYRT